MFIDCFFITETPIIHETFNGKDAQLDAAIKLLLEKIEEDPRDVPAVPDYPNKSFKNNR